MNNKIKANEPISLLQTTHNFLVKERSRNKRIRCQLNAIDPGRTGFANFENRALTKMEEKVSKDVSRLNISGSIHALCEVLPKGVRILISSESGVLEFEPSRTRDGYIDDFYKMLDDKDEYPPASIYDDNGDRRSASP